LGPPNELRTTTTSAESHSKHSIHRPISSTQFGNYTGQRPKAL